MASSGRTVFRNQVCPGVPQDGAPDFALIVNFSRRVWNDRITGNANVEIRLGRINVFESDGIFRQVGGVRIMADAKIIIIRKAAKQLIRDVAAFGIIGSGIVGGIGGEREAVKIRPPLAQAARLQGADADTPADARAYVVNAKAQVTIWGGDGGLADYASKAWQGLYRDFYLPRWSQFLDALRTAGAAPFDEGPVVRGIAAWEQAWVERDAAYARQSPADPVGATQALLARLARP